MSASAKRHRRKRLCETCGKRPALYRQPGTGRIAAADHHRQCWQCYRAVHNAAGPRQKRPPVVVTITVGAATDTITMRADLDWAAQNRRALELLHRIRTLKPEGKSDSASHLE